MIWLIPLLLICLFLLFRFVSPYEVNGSQELDGTVDSVVTPGYGLDGYAPNGYAPNGYALEGFQALLVSPTFQKGYREFLVFYEEFQTRWREALDTVDSMSREVGTAAKERTDAERNGTVRGLTASLGKPLPLLVPLPANVETLEDLERAQLLERIPPSAQPYQDALEWMNQSLLQAQKELDKMLQGGIPSLEGFALERFTGKGQCAEIAQCFKDNPDLIRQVVTAQQADAATRLEQIQRELMERFQQFQQPRLQSAFETNGRLRANAKEVQRKAQSGDWIKDIKIGSNEVREKPVLPPGGTALEDLRRSNPERYAQLQKSPLFSVKQLMEQINRNLR